MRLLPTWTDHVGRRAAHSHNSTYECRYRPSHGRESLPLRHLLPHSQRHPPGCRGDALMSTKPSPAPVETRPTLSRRTFLATSAAAGGALVVGLTLRGRLHQASSDSHNPFNAWIRIYPDGQIHLVLNKSEMGQGVFTALPMILAEEAEVDF